MTDLPQFDKVCNAAHQSLASAFFWFGDEVVKLIESGEYRHISAAGMAVSDYLRTQGQSFAGHKITTAFVYSSHQAATKFGKAERTIFIKHNCPFHILLRLAGQPLEIVAEILADVQAGKVDWQGCAKRKHKPPSPRRAKHWQQNYDKINAPSVPRGETPGCRSPGRESSQINPPAVVAGESINVEDDDSIVFGLANVIRRLGKRFPRYLQMALDAANKGQPEEKRVKL